MCLCSAAPDVMFRDLENFIRTMGITHLSLTPTVAALVEPNNVPQVKFLVTAGEALTDKVFKTWSGNGLFQGESIFFAVVMTRLTIQVTVQARRPISALSSRLSWRLTTSIT